MSILAIDQGTTSTKAFLWTEAGVREERRLRHRQIRPRQGWVEHDPEELIANLRSLIAARPEIEALGLANQGETVVAWDAVTKRPLYNAIVWQDERTADAIEKLKSSGIEELTLARAGLPLDSYFSATKLRWLLDNAEDAKELLRQGRLRLGTSDAFFLDRLTGVFATDPSTASRTSLMDIHTLKWDQSLCEAFGVPQECLPEIRATDAEFGQLDNGAPIVCSIVDQQASLFGHGCNVTGDIKLTFGTGAFVLGLTSSPALGAISKGLLPTCAWQVGDDRPSYALDGGVLSAGAAVEWLKELNIWSSHEALELSGQTALERGPIFVPALSGLGSPYWDRSARAAWLGMDLTTQPSDLYRAVLEGVALRATQIVRVMSETMGTTRRIAVDGGLTKSAPFVRFLSNAIGAPLEVADSAEVTAIGVLQICVERLKKPGVGKLAGHSIVTPDAPLPAHLHERFARAVSLIKEHGRTGG